MTKSIQSTKNIDLLQNIESGKRDHFRELLVTMLNCQPTKAAIKKAANKNPTSFFNSLKTVSDLAGYHQGSTEVTNNYMLEINGMSDSALRQALEHSMGNIIDVLPESIPGESLTPLELPADKEEA